MNLLFRKEGIPGTNISNSNILGDLQGDVFEMEELMWRFGWTISRKTGQWLRAEKLEV